MVLVDGNDCWLEGGGEALSRGVVQRAQQAPQALAGTFDTCKGCCLIETARKMAEAAQAGPGPALFELHEYPGADHGFSTDNAKRRDTRADALRRTVDFLVGHPGAS